MIILTRTPQTIYNQLSLQIQAKNRTDISKCLNKSATHNSYQLFVSELKIQL